MFGAVFCVSGSVVSYHGVIVETFFGVRAHTPWSESSVQVVAASASYRSSVYRASCAWALTDVV